MKEHSHTECFIIEARLNDNRLKLYEKIDIKIIQLGSSDEILKILVFSVRFGSVQESSNFFRFRFGSVFHFSISVRFEF
jgi:hypothetical protein